MCKHLILVAVCSILLQARAFAAHASEDTIAVFKAAIEAFKAVEHPLTGKGSALVEMYYRKYPELTMKRMVDFMFKENLSRSTSFSMKEGKLEQPEVLWVVGEKCSVTYNYLRRYAGVQRDPPLQFYHRIGYDFNPSTFMECYGTPLTVHTDRVLDGPATLSTKMDSDGILHLITDYRDQNVRTHQDISVDPAKGYRLVDWFRIMERFDRPERSHTDFFEIEWDKYESSWYAKAAKMASYAGVHSPEDISSLRVENVRTSIAVTVTEFDPNVEINDSEFTLNGLGLPVGTLIVDKISGTNYKIDSGPQSTDTLQKTLLEAESDKSIKNQVDIKDVKQDATAIGERAESEKKTSISDEESTQESMADKPNHPHKQRNVLMIISLLVGIVFVMVIGLHLLPRIK